MIVCKIMAIAVTCALPYQMDLDVAVLRTIPWIPTAGTAVVSFFWSSGACDHFQHRALWAAQ